MEEDLTLTLAIVRNRLLAAKADERDGCVLKEVAAKVSERGDDRIPFCWERHSSWDEELFLKGMLVEYIEVASVDRIKSLFALFGQGARG